VDDEVAEAGHLAEVEPLRVVDPAGAPKEIEELVVRPESSRPRSRLVHVDRRPRGEDRRLRRLVPRDRPTLPLVLPPEVVVVSPRPRVKVE
jgi:hypothetical protein